MMEDEGKNREPVINGHTVDEVWLLMLDENIAAYEKEFGMSSAYWVNPGDTCVQVHNELEGRDQNPRIAPTFDFLKWSRQRVVEAMREVEKEMSED